MSTQLTTVIYKARGKGRRRRVRHLATPYAEQGRTLCGKTFDSGRVLPIERRRIGDTPLCGTCDHVRRTTAFTRDAVVPEPTEDAAVKGAALLETGGIAEIPARVFRVAGDSDSYTVTIPLDTGLASLCNCMAGKVKPGEMCKHQGAVYLWIGKGNDEERKVSA